MASRTAGFRPLPDVESLPATYLRRPGPGGPARRPGGWGGGGGRKPPYGRVSRSGVVAFASSLDQCGPFGRSVRDVALVLCALAGHDPRDATSVPEPGPGYGAPPAR